MDKNRKLKDAFDEVVDTFKASSAKDLATKTAFSKWRIGALKASAL